MSLPDGHLGAISMDAVAESAGVGRENLYRALSGNTRPEFETIHG